MDTLPHRSVTHVSKLYCHLCLQVQQLVPYFEHIFLGEWKALFYTNYFGISNLKLRLNSEKVIIKYTLDPEVNLVLCLRNENAKFVPGNIRKIDNLTIEEIG
jgi:hypothetical protein